MKKNSKRTGLTDSGITAHSTGQEFSELFKKIGTFMRAKLCHKTNTETDGVNMKKFRRNSACMK